MIRWLARKILGEGVRTFELPDTEDLDAKYKAMAAEPESATGGPTLAGRLKYLEQVARHGS